MTPKLVLESFVKIAILRSKGKGGRIVADVGNQFAMQRIPLARIYDYDRFIACWNDRTTPQLVEYITEEEATP